jgi:aspartyl-tRNA synthetase
VQKALQFREGGEVVVQGGDKAEEQTTADFMFGGVNDRVADLLTSYSFREDPVFGDPPPSFQCAGFVHAVRDHGEVVFIDLRDDDTLIQVVAAPDLTPASFQVAKGLRPESTVTVDGYLRRRPPDTQNPADPLGSIELVATRLVVHALAQALPYPVHEDEDVHEAIRLRYRYLQLRKSKGLRHDLVFRSHFVHALKSGLLNQGFIDVETPVLFKSTPEGARDFIVPSRQNGQTFYALVQSPQMLKQLLMVGGVPRYVQLCKCFRDEDMRADRQPEFTQLDMEAAFTTPAQLRACVERALRQSLGSALLPLMRQENSEPTDDLHAFLVDENPLRVLSHQTAMERYGTDAPDLRFDLPLHDGATALAQTGLQTFQQLLSKGAPLRYLCLPSGAGELSRNFLDTLPGFAQEHGGQGLAWLRKQSDGSWQGPIAKFLTPDEFNALEHVVLSDPLHSADPSMLAPGAMLFFSCHMNPKIVFSTLGALRLRIARELNLRRRKWSLLWVSDFPMFEWDGVSKSLSCAHHPFTLPDA